MAKLAQQFIPIKEIRDGTVVLKTSEMRAVLLTSSVNFTLKSEDEQLALLGQFATFLNSLEFSIQIFLESRRLDIRPYLMTLEERYKEQVSDLLKIQTREYIEFVKSFTETSDIMKKKFFIVVPFMPPVVGKGSKGSLAKMFSLGGKGKQTDTESKLESFEENQTQLLQRIDVVEQGMARVGIRTVRLNTEELIELYYKLFNPGELGKPAIPEQKT